jgi:hypothetical protein
VNMRFSQESPRFLDCIGTRAHTHTHTHIMLREAEGLLLQRALQLHLELFLRWVLRKVQLQ